MRVIGTSGHVDHGKSTLVQQLTGINPDRLAEEQSRKMTIDLGFAWMQLPDGDMLGIVDVPGHRDFIENMLAGVGGVDLALLVIAADEGVMPQTREHLAILDLLGIENIIVALTKIDLIDDPDWIDLVTLDVEELLATTRLGDCPIIPVSAITGDGLDTLVQHIQAKLQQLPQRVNYHHPRLPVDRVFSVSGFGTVVTGTLSGGTLSLGDNIETQPSRRIGRIRGLQSYKQDVETASPGSRVAVNIVGISKDQIQRGDVITYPGQIHPTLLVDVFFQHLSDADRPLKHNAEVKFFSGASETLANVRLLNDESILPSADGWLQIRLRDEIPLSRGDRFILRYPSPPQTIGGGIIVNPHPGRRWKRFQADVIQDIEMRLDGTPSERLAQTAKGDVPQKIQALQKSTGYSDEEIQDALHQALEESLILQLDDNLFWSTSSHQKTISQLLTEVAIYHEEYPLRLGILRPELRSRLNIKLNLLDLLLESTGQVVNENNFVRLSDHHIQFSDKQEENIETVLALLTQKAFSPPSISDLNQIAGESVIRALIDLKEIINISDDIGFSKSAYEAITQTVLGHIDQYESIDAKALRDKLDTSRKYAIAVLEHLDSLGITQRIGDVRKRGRNAPPV
jgi:selenocysteine-specific elongation factor